MYWSAIPDIRHYPFNYFQLFPKSLHGHVVHRLIQTMGQQKTDKYLYTLSLSMKLSYFQSEIKWSISA
jgi:hypothetical protein